MFARPSRRRAAAFALALVLGAVGCRARSFRAEDRAAIEALLAAQQAAWNRGDLEAFMAGYWRDPGLSFASGADVQRGFAGTMERYQRRYPNAAAMGVLGFRIEEIRPLGPDAALVLGHFTLTETPRAGTGVFSLVLQRRPEGWRIVHDHTSG